MSASKSPDGSNDVVVAGASVVVGSTVVVGAAVVEEVVAEEKVSGVHLLKTRVKTYGQELQR